MPARPSIARSFRDIREWDDSKERAFEELCFQLRDPAPPDVELVKPGAPDAGAEWYWRFPDGREWVWQVKFITKTSDLLDAMRASLDTVAEKRPRAERLTFCIAQDLADDPSESRGKQARQRFDEARTRWKRRAPGIEIHLIGGGELLERLAREEHRGRDWFFFNQHRLSRQWCEEELQGTIEDAGDRYTPQQNVDLPIDRVLEAAAQPEDFERDITEQRNALLRKAREVLKDRRAPGEWADDVARLKTAVAAFEAVNLLGSLPPTIEATVSAAALDGLDAVLRDVLANLRPVAWPRQDESSPTSSPTSPEEDAAERVRQARRDSARDLRRDCTAVLRMVSTSRSALRGMACRAAERRAVFLTGPAGRGKTHLCCDVGERLLAAGHPVIVLLGEKFRDDSVWDTLARLLGNPGLSPSEVAICLAAAGEASGRRMFVCIDAINESRDPGIWKADLSELRRRLTASGWVGLVITCRSTYVDLVEPPAGLEPGFAVTEHPGYRGREFEATERIFAAHGVQQPRAPLLLPEFTDPLFLKLYCEGVRDSAEPPTGSEHLSTVFARFSKARAERVEQKLNLDKRLGIVGDAMSGFASALARNAVEGLPYREAAALINALAPHATASPDTLIEAMASEGLLSIDRRHLQQGDEPAEVVGFPYQRFSDHQVLASFLRDRLPDDAPRDAVLAAFAPDAFLGQWLTQASGGAIEALAIQLPERWGVELIDVVDMDADDWPAQAREERAWEAFVFSIVARDRSAFTERTSMLVNDALERDPREVADALISVAPDPAHPYNADRLHQFLVGMTMPERDAYWTSLQYHEFGDPTTALDRLVRWAARGPYPGYPADVVFLAASALCWAFASPNRFARDYTTKALASLLMSRLELVTALVERYARIDDPYIRQRIAAVALGAVTRGGIEPLDGPQATTLLETLVARFIEADDVVPDILLRDYVATLARWLFDHDVISASLEGRARKPPKARRPKMPRSRSYLESTYDREGTRDENHSTLIYSALFLESDWSRYVVSGAVDDFLPVLVGESFSEPERSATDQYRFDQRAWRRFVDSLRKEQVALLGTDPDDLDWQRLFSSLEPDQQQRLDKVLVPRKTRRRRPDRPMAFPPERASRFIFQRCIELGWTPKRFAGFDSTIGDASRSSNKGERFGKKYQWIAFHELMARLADNFAYRQWREIEPYDPSSVRDFDPTLPPERIAVGDGHAHTRTRTFPPTRHPGWWAIRQPEFEPQVVGQEGEWANRRDDLPTPGNLARVRDGEGRDWVVAKSFQIWRDSHDAIASVVAEDTADRDLSISSGSALVPVEDVAALEAWLGETPDLWRALPDWHSQGVWHAFWAELPAAQDRFDHPGGWRSPGEDSKLPVPCTTVVLDYSSESSSLDSSLSHPAGASLPSRMLAELGALRWSEPANGWIGRSGGVDARYWETDEDYYRSHAFMIRETALAEWLTANGLALAIGLFSERRVFDFSRGSRPDSLGWVDYAGYVLFDGREWTSFGLVPIERQV